MNHASPLPEEFARATRSGRFAVLHEAAEALLDDLGKQYTVERRETKESLAEDGPLVRTVWLVPHTPAAATLAVGFSEFPRVVLRFGRWYQQALPACGCDVCDEDPAVLTAEMRAQVTALVEGGLWERVRRGLGGSWSEALLVGTDFRVSQQAALVPSEARAARREGFAAAAQWAPWPRRNAVSRADDRADPRPGGGPPR
jgi:hypothetical protein